MKWINYRHEGELIKTGLTIPVGSVYGAIMFSLFTRQYIVFFRWAHDKRMPQIKINEPRTNRRRNID